MNALDQKRVIVCCGAGGVGKTTVSASLALRAARQGRRVLVVTIDPSKRLAETLGIAQNLEKPMPLPADRLEAAGIKAPGSLSAWILDPQRICDQTVHANIKDPREAERLLQNRIYRNVTAMIAGMQEYTAVEALHGFISEDCYDLVVLDTPPSRNALRFLEAPSRAMAFLDHRIFNLFVPNESGLIRKMASHLIEKVMDIAFGESTRRDLQIFFQLFSHILTHLNHNQSEMQEFFRNDSVGFLLVTSPAQAALEEAHYFEQKTTVELHLPLLGYVLNRSHEALAKSPDPAPSDDPILSAALEKLAPFITQERQKAESDAALAQALKARTGFVAILPVLPGGASDISTLTALSDALDQALESP